MKKISLLVLSFLMVGVCFPQSRSVKIRVTNPSGFSRQQETISVSLKELQRYFSPIQNSMIVLNPSGEEILSQLFDSNHDGQPDVLLFQVDLASQQTKTFSVYASDHHDKEVSSLVDARYVEPREDLAWENDRIAFRMYGPALAAEVNNGIDVWVKRVRYPIVKKWYEGEEQTPKIIYHVDHGEGADFFDVGRSLGCGGAGILYNKTLYQPGVFSSYKILSTGPIRACFELYYDKWDVQGTKIKEIKRITLDAGQNLNKIEEIYSTAADIRSIEIATGLVKRKNTKPTFDEQNGWMSLWGQTNDSLVNGYLGTGVVLSPDNVVGTAADSVQYLMIGKAVPDSSFVYYAGAGWTRSGDFSSAAEWNKYLERWSQMLRWPLKIDVAK